MPDVIVIAGPNGAGKSTLAPALLRDTLHVFEYVNADTKLRKDYQLSRHRMPHLMPGE